ncbi:MAG: hypothetical protein R3260_00135 [Pseudomonas sp.]|nr:hypothetical protein [Pseudomonas sp.]
MKNRDDYDAGWTGKVFNPKTGKTPSGGAARSLRIAQMGGAEAVFNAGGVHALAQVVPFIEQLQGQIATAQLINEEMARRLERIVSKGSK